MEDKIVTNVLELNDINIGSANFYIKYEGQFVQIPFSLIENKLSSARLIDDTNTSSDTTLSANKIYALLQNKADSISSVTFEMLSDDVKLNIVDMIKENANLSFDIVDGAKIDDNTINSEDTYSSQKIESRIKEIAEATTGIDDYNISNTTVYSSKKTADLNGMTVIDGTLYTHKKHNGMMTIIEDDGGRYTIDPTALDTSSDPTEFNQTICAKDLYDKYNVRISFGIVPEWLKLTISELHDLEKQGYEILNHSWNHSATDMNVNGTSKIITSEIAEDQVSQSDAWFKQNGFNPKAFVYPYGWYDDTSLSNIKAVLQSYGYKYGIDSNRDIAVPKDKTINLFNLPRIKLSDSLLDDVKVHMLSAVENDEWIILMSHSNSTYYKVETIEEILRYAEEIGLEIKTFGTAAKERIEVAQNTGEIKEIVTGDGTYTVGSIDDSEPTSTTTYSSQKIEDIKRELEDSSGSGIINDEKSELDKTYSSNKINELLNENNQRIILDSEPSQEQTYSSQKIESLLSGVGDTSIDDSAVRTDGTYSSNKINSVIDSKILDAVFPGITTYSDVFNMTSTNITERIWYASPITNGTYHFKLKLSTTSSTAKLTLREAPDNATNTGSAIIEFTSGDFASANVFEFDYTFTAETPYIYLYLANFKGNTVTLSYQTENADNSSILSNVLQDNCVSNITTYSSTKIENRLAELQSNLASDETMPQYVLDETTAVIDRVQALQTASSTTFIFMTDLHYTPISFSHALYAMNEIRKNVSVRFVCFGGDYLHNPAGTTAETAIAQYNAMNNEIKKYDNLQCIPIVGNHDENPMNYAVTIEEFLSRDDMARVFFKRLQDNSIIVDPENRRGLYGYYDLNSDKIRFLFVNVCDYIVKSNDDGTFKYSIFQVSPRQLDFFIEALNSIPDGWNVVVFSHCPLQIGNIYNSAVSTAVMLFDILDAFNNKTKYSKLNYTNNGYTYNTTADFTENKGGHVICLLNGHEHTNRDGMENGIKMVSTQVAQSGNNTSSRLPSSDGNIYSTSDVGSRTETAFDVVTINPDNKKIYFTRYGQGYDREFYYADSDSVEYTTLLEFTSTNSSTAEYAWFDVMLEPGMYRFKISVASAYNCQLSLKTASNNTDDKSGTSIFDYSYGSFDMSTTLTTERAVSETLNYVMFYQKYIPSGKKIKVEYVKVN